jgi:hypothetical protein
MKKHLLLAIILFATTSTQAQFAQHCYRLPWAKISPSVKYLPQRALLVNASLFKNSDAELKTSTYFSWDQNANTWGDTQNNVIFTWNLQNLTSSVNNYYSIGKIFSRDLNTNYQSTLDYGTEIDGYLAVNSLHQTKYDTNWVNDQMQTISFDKKTYIASILYQKYYLDTLRNSNKLVYLLDSKDHYSGWLYYTWNSITNTFDTTKGRYTKYVYNSAGDVVESHVFESDWQNPGHWILSTEKYDLNPDGSIKLMRIYDVNNNLTDSVILGWNSFNKNFIDHNGDYVPAIGGDKQNNIQWYSKDNSGH